MSTFGDSAIQIDEVGLNRFSSLARRFEEILFNMERLLLEGAVQAGQPAPRTPDGTWDYAPSLQPPELLEAHPTRKEGTDASDAAEDRKEVSA